MSTMKHDQSYMMLNVDHDKRKQVTEELNRENDVRSVAQVFGRFDLVLKINAKNPEQKYELVQRIRAIPGVTAINAPETYEGFNTTQTPLDSNLTAYCLLRVNRPLTEVMKNLKRWPAITEAWAIGGDFEIIASLTGKTHQELSKFVISDLEKVDGISTTETLFTFEPHVKAG